MLEKLDTLTRTAHPGPEGPPPASPWRKPLRARLASALPVLLLLAFLLLAWLLFGDRFARSRQVVLVPVVTLRAPDSGPSGFSAGAGDGETFSGKTLFQASGWIEPDPLPIRAAALYSGIVETVHVLEGDTVGKGQLLTTLVDDDARLDLETAKAALGEAAATLRNLEAREASARAGLETLDFEIAAAEARLVELEDDAGRFSRAGPEVFPQRTITQAELRATTQRATVTALEAQREEEQAELNSRAALVEQAEAQLRRAHTEVARRQLALDRTRVQSPVDGVIQRLFVAPGSKRMVAMDDPDSATVAMIYQPDSLQARIDVPLDEAGRLSVGQAVRLRSSVLPDRVFKGRVERIEGQADLQRNTLQAKVSILDPDAKLRPEMLCRAEFLAPVSAGSRGSSGGRTAVYVPEGAVMHSGSRTEVWLLDASGERVVRETVELADERREDHIRVRSGLGPGDRVVVDPPADLKPGERVKGTDGNEGRERG